MIILKGRVPHRATAKHSQKNKKTSGKEKAKYASIKWGRSKLVLSCLIVSQGKGGWVVNKFLYGDPLPFYIPFFTKKAPLSYNFC